MNFEINWEDSMIRKVIKIDEDKCVGCGLCANACHQSAIGIVNGKAKLLSDNYCDGLGMCMPKCPTGAITFEEREADAYDKSAVAEHKATLAPSALHDGPMPSALQQWPVQIKLVPVNAPYFNDAHLLIAADCTAFAYANFHGDFMKNRITLIGCPKLDEGDYSEKLTAILEQNQIKSVTVARMEVPCCGGLSNAAILALKNCSKMVPWNVAVISTEGEVIPQ